MKTEVGGPFQTLYVHLNAVSELSLGGAKVGLSKTDGSVPTYTQDIMYCRIARKLLLTH